MKHLDLSKDLAKTRNPASWPFGFMLPMKRYINLKPNGSMDGMDFGRLFHSDDGRYRFVNDADKTEQLGGDELLLKLNQEGWMVD